MSERLNGGRDNIIKKDGILYRPSNEWSVYVQEFLKFLHKHGFDTVPYPLGFTKDGQEMLTFIEGDVFNNELPTEVKSIDALISFAKYIRKFHDLGANYIERLSGEEKWMLPIGTKVETMCHGDLAPYNTVMKGGKVMGLIDFDTLHPGSRLWDISYALYRWIPLMADENPENFGTLLDKENRIKHFMAAYGGESLGNGDLFMWVIRRLEYLISFMHQEAASGNETFKGHIEAGHVIGYRKDIEYIRKYWLAKSNRYMV